MMIIEQPGWYPISNEEHHAQKAISSSALKLYCQSPERYYHKYVARDWHSDTYSTAFLIGTCVHMFLLEPDKAETCITYCEEKSTTKAYKEFVKSKYPDIDWEHPSNSLGRFALKDGSNVYVLTESAYLQVRAMVASALEHKLFRRLAEPCTPELSGFAKFRGNWMSCRGDLKSNAQENAYFVDVKTIDSINDYSLQNQIFSFGYHLQHLHYLHVANLIEGANLYTRFYFFFVEKSFPHECRVVHLDASPAEMEVLRQHYMNKLYELCDRIEQNDFQNKAKEVCGRVRIPSWVMDRFI